MIFKVVNELRTSGIRMVIYHIRMVLTKKEKDIYLYYSFLHKNKSLKELEKDLEKEFEYCNLYKMDFSNPQTYCQKVYWLRLYGGTPLKTKLADKFLCREYINNIIGEEYNVPLLGVWDTFEQVDFDKLPTRFVLKANHGCGFNIIVKNKKTMDKSKVKKLFDRWLNTNYALVYCEMQYYRIPKKIIAEEYLEQLDGGLYDYKIHCFNGQPIFCELIGERDIDKCSAKQAVYDLKWNLLEFTFGDFEQFDHLIDKPKCLEEMIEVSRKLAAEIDYVRVDLYVVDDRIYVGELTFTSSGGNNPNITPKCADLELGRMIHLDAPYYFELEKTEY